MLSAQRKFLGWFKEVPCVFQENFKGVSRELQGCFKKVLRVLNGVLRGVQECFKAVHWVFKGSLKGVSGMFPGSLRVF